MALSVNSDIKIHDITTGKVLISIENKYRVLRRQDGQPTRQLQIMALDSKSKHKIYNSHIIKEQYF